MLAHEYPPQQYKKLIRHASQYLADSAFRFVDEKDKKSKEIQQDSKAKLIRESRLIPELVFQIEQLDHLIIKYSKTTKSNIDIFLKRRAARDFKIDREEVDAVADNGKDSKKEKRKSSDRFTQSQSSKKPKALLNIEPLPAQEDEEEETIVLPSDDSETEQVGRNHGSNNDNPNFLFD